MYSNGDLRLTGARQLNGLSGRNELRRRLMQFRVAVIGNAHLRAVRRHAIAI